MSSSEEILGAFRKLFKASNIAFPVLGKDASIEKSKVIREEAWKINF